MTLLQFRKVKGLEYSVSGLRSYFFRLFTTPGTVNNPKQ